MHHDVIDIQNFDINILRKAQAPHLFQGGNSLLMIFNYILLLHAIKAFMSDIQTNWLYLLHKQGNQTSDHFCHVQQTNTSNVFGFLVLAIDFGFAVCKK